MIEYVITGMVLHKPLTGYDIKKEIELGIGNFYKSSNGNLYPALKKLTEKGHLILTEQTHVERLKKYYIATESGKAAFLEWLKSPIDKNSLSISLLTRVFFLGELPKDIRSQKLQEYELEMLKILEAHKKIEKQFADSIKSDRDYFELSTLYYGLQTAQGMIRWLKYIKEEKPLSKFTGERNEEEYYA